MNVLETPRLLLRHAELSDAAFLIELLNDPAWLKYIGDRNVRTLEAARSYLTEKFIAHYEQFGFGLYVTQLRDSAIPIGVCGLIKRPALADVDIGFAFLPDFRGQGFAFEAATAVMKFGRQQHGLPRIVAVTAPQNSVAAALLEKLGMQFERLVKLAPDLPETRLFVPREPVTRA